MSTKIKGQYMNRSAFWMIKYMNGSFFPKAKYMNGVGFEILARTPVPKLPLSYPPLPHPEGIPGYILLSDPFRMLRFLIPIPIYIVISISLLHSMVE